MTVINLIPEVYLIITIVLFIILILINHLIFNNKYSILFICMFSCFLSFFIKSMFFPISIFFGSMKDEMWNTLTHSMFYLNPITEVNKILSMNSSLIIKHLLIMIPFGLLINELVHFKEKNKTNRIRLSYFNIYRSDRTYNQLCNLFQTICDIFIWYHHSYIWCNHRNNDMEYHTKM